MSSDTALAAEPPTPDQGASFTYDAFLSYNHQDGAVAAGIQKGLHRIGHRVGRLNALRVFRDSTDLAANPDLWGKVTDTMDRSRYLIVVLSPRAAASEWVNREVAHWLGRRGPEQLLIVVAEGQLHWDEATCRFDPDRSDAALPVLTEPGVLAAEPLHVDISGDAPWDPHAPTFRDKVTDLAAPIHGKSKYELASDDVREQRRFRRLRRAAIAGLAVLTVIAVAAAVIAVVQRQEAVQQRQEAVQQRNQAEARRLVAEAQPMLAGTQRSARSSLDDKGRSSISDESRFRCSCSGRARRRSSFAGPRRSQRPTGLDVVSGTAAVMTAGEMDDLWRDAFVAENEAGLHLTGARTASPSATCSKTVRLPKRPNAGPALR